MAAPGCQVQFLRFGDPWMGGEVQQQQQRGEAFLRWALGGWVGWGAGGLGSAQYARTRQTATTLKTQTRVAKRKWEIKIVGTT